MKSNFIKIILISVFSFFVTYQSFSAEVKEKKENSEKTFFDNEITKKIDERDHFKKIKIYNELGHNPISIQLIGSDFKITIPEEETISQNNSYLFKGSIGKILQINVIIHLNRAQTKLLEQQIDSHQKTKFPSSLMTAIVGCKCKDDNCPRNIKLQSSGIENSKQLIVSILETKTGEIEISVRCDDVSKLVVFKSNPGEFDKQKKILSFQTSRILN